MSSIRRLGRSSAMSDVEMRKRQLLADTERLARSGTRLLWLFSEHEPLHDELSQSGFLPRLAGISSVTVRPSADTFAAYYAGKGLSRVSTPIDVAFGMTMSMQRSSARTIIALP